MADRTINITITDSQVDFIKANCTTMTAKQISLALGVKVSKLYENCNKLGIEFKTHDDFNREQILKKLEESEYFIVDPVEKYNWVVGYEY